MTNPKTELRTARLDAATPHGRSLHQRFHKGSCPSEYGEDCWQLQDILAIEAEAASQETAAWLAEGYHRSERAAEQSVPLDPIRLQRAMKEAHGRRISTTETYAEAIARRYNAVKS